MKPQTSTLKRGVKGSLKGTSTGALIEPFDGTLKGTLAYTSH